MAPLGGDLSSRDLMKYRYMAGMEKFDKPVKLAEYNSFDEAVLTINRGLAAHKGKTVKVYEIIVQDNTASMLHGRYRFALHWPELTMKTFTKIMSTPGDVKEFMEKITQE